MRIAYYRVSTSDQSIEAQRHAMGGDFDREFTDHAVSGGVMAAQRQGFAKLVEQARVGDTVHVYAVDRLGRDAIDVQQTVRRLTEAGVKVAVHGLGELSGDVGRLILAVLAQIADMERGRIKARTDAGRAAARERLQAGGKTRRGRDSLGRPKAADAASVVAWRADNGASIQDTARQWGLSEATVKRYGKLAKAEADPLARVSPEAVPRHGADEVQPFHLSPTSQLSQSIQRLRQDRDSLSEQAPLNPDKDPLDL